MKLHFAIEEISKNIFLKLYVKVKQKSIGKLLS